MNNSFKYGIIILLLIGAGFTLHFMNEADQPAMQKEVAVDAINWQKTYDSQSNHPYGTYLLRELLEKGWEHNKFQSLDAPLRTYFASDSLTVSSDPINYLFIGAELKLYNSEVDSLLALVEKGNSAFIAAEYFPSRLLSSLLNFDYQGYMTEMQDTAVNMYFTEDHLNTGVYQLLNEIDSKNIEREWRVWAFGLYSVYDKKTIGKIGSKDFFVEFKYGQGTIYLHTIPQSFTNNFLKTDQGRTYVETALSYLPEGTVLWDDYTPYIKGSSAYEIDYGDERRNSKSGSRINTKSMISLLLKSPPLKWAYLIIFVGMILFVVFMGKRRQKVIPTTLSNKNTSLEFTETISRIYLQQNQHNKLIKHMETIFRDKIKSKYFIQYTDDESYAERIAKKSGVQESEVKRLLELFKAGVHVNEVSDHFLIDLYTAIQEFYKKAK